MPRRGRFIRSGHRLAHAAKRCGAAQPAFNNSSLNFVELEMKAAGIVTFGTDLVNPDFAAVASAMGMFGRRVEQPGDLDAALIEAFAHDGRAVVDVVAARQELSIAAAGDHDRTGEGLVAVRN